MFQLAHYYDLVQRYYYHYPPFLFISSENLYLNLIISFVLL